MSLLRIENTKRTTDEDGRLSEEYTVEADASENIETIIEAYGPQNTRLPQIEAPNRFRLLAGNPRMTFVDKIKVSHDGKDHNTYKVTVSYTPPNESTQDNNNNVTTDYPWDEATEFGQTGDIITLASTGKDKAGQPYKYSNGGLVVTEVPVPITNLNLVRKPLKSKRNSFSLSSQFFQTINDSNVTIDGATYPKWTLLVQAFDVTLVRFKERDANTGNVTVTKYYIENIVLSYNKLQWLEPIVDEGIMVKQTIQDGNDGEVEIYVPVTNKYTGDLTVENVALNGQGQPIFDEKGVDVNPASTTGKTKQGVKISTELSVANGAGAQTVLLFSPYELKGFSGLKLNEGI